MAAPQASPEWTYFSNFIEGTEFAVEEAANIVFKGVIPTAHRQQEHHRGVPIKPRQVEENDEEASARIARDLPNTWVFCCVQTSDRKALK